MTAVEPPERPIPAWRDIIASLDGHMPTNAVVAWLYTRAIEAAIVRVNSPRRRNLLKPATVLAPAESLLDAFVDALGDRT